MSKTKTLISFAVTAKLPCAFVLHMQIVGFPMRRLKCIYNKVASVPQSFLRLNKIWINFRLLMIQKGNTLRSIRVQHALVDGIVWYCKIHVIITLITLHTVFFIFNLTHLSRLFQLI